MLHKIVEKYKNSKCFLHAPVDINLVFALIFLNVFGVIMIYSASYYYAEEVLHGYSQDSFMIGQLQWVLLGIVIMLLISIISTNFWRKFWVLGLVLAVGFLVAVRIPGLGRESHGAYRWLNLGGFSLQVAEPIKIFVIVFFAGVLSTFKITERFIRNSIFLTIALLAGGLLILSNNMSTAAIVFGIGFFMMMLISPSQKGYFVFIGLALTAVIAVVLAVKFAIPYEETENFRITRLRAWLDPTNPLYSGDEAFQATQALYAIASGGFFGKGLGQSLIKFRLPEPHNDYILAIVFEELGIFGVILLTFLFVYLLYRIFLIYRDARDLFSKYLVLGIFLHIAIQVILNYAVVTGMLPTMGITLPFISYGGTSVFLTLAEMGLVLAVGRQNVDHALYREVRAEVEAEDPILQRAKERKRAARRG